jgi:hypothetical protein
VLDRRFKRYFKNGWYARAIGGLAFCTHHRRAGW